MNSYKLHLLVLTFFATHYEGLSTLQRGQEIIPGWKTPRNWRRAKGTQSDTTNRNCIVISQGSKLSPFTHTVRYHCTFNSQPCLRNCVLQKVAVSSSNIRRKTNVAKCQKSTRQDPTPRKRRQWETSVTKSCRQTMSREVESKWVGVMSVL